MAKVKRLSQDEYEKIVSGGEPTFTESVLTQIEMITALNWYTANRDTKASMKYVQDYFKKNKIKLDTQVAESELNTFGWVCRIVTRGGVLTELHQQWFDDRIKRHTLSGNKTESIQKETSNVISIQDRINQKVDEIVGELEGSVDDFILSGFKKTPSPHAIMQDKVKSVHANKIVDIFKKNRSEIQEVIDTDDDQLKEGYSNFTKLQLKKLLGYYDLIINEAIKLSDEAKSTRKPRKRKIKTPDQLVSKLKILTEDTNLNLKSEDPKKIIGAMQLWIFNVKTRKLGVYHADDASGLSMKGSTVINFNEQKSICKTLRKPEQVLSNVVKGGKVFLRNAMESIKAKQKNLTGRLNGDTILVKVV
jgi:hypothetical protein